MSRIARRTTLATLAGAVLAAGALAEAPAALAKIVTLAPGDVRGVLHIDTGPGFHDWVFGWMPMGDRYREVFTERARIYHERTGVHPLRDVKGISVVFSEADGQKHMVGFTKMDGNVQQLAKALAADEGLKEQLTFHSDYEATMGEKMKLRFVNGGMIFGRTETMENLRGKGNRGSSPLTDIAAEVGGPTPRFMFAAGRDVPEMPASAKVDMAAGGGEKRPPNPMMALMTSSSGAIGWGGNHFEIRVEAKTAEEAAAAKDFLQQGLDKAMKSLEEAGKADPASASLAELMSPQKISVESWRRWAKDFLQPLSFTADDKVVRIRRARGLPEMPLSVMTLPMIGVAAAIAVPNFQAARGRANLRACYANQKVFAGALEMYNLDYNANVQVLDDAMRQKLVENGYLMRMPTDPGEGPDSADHYYFDDASGNGIACKVHGSLDQAVPAQPGKGMKPSRPSGAAAALPAMMKMIGGMMGAGGKSDGRAGPFAAPPGK